MGTACGNGQPWRPPVAESIWSDKNCYDRLMLHRAKCWRYNIATCTCTIDAEAIDEISWSVQYLVPRRALRLSVTEFLRDSANSLVVNSISRPLRSLSLSLFPLFLSRVVSLLSSGGWFDALINDRVDNVGHGVPPIGYRVEWRDIQTFFSPDSCHWFWKLDDFIHFRDQNFEWRADLKFKSIRSDRDHYRNFATRFCADWHIFSHLERRMDTVAFSGSDIGRFDVSERRRGERKRRARLARSWETPFCGYDVSL